MIVDYLRSLKTKLWGSPYKEDKTISTLTVGSDRIVSLIGNFEAKTDDADHFSPVRSGPTISIEGIGVSFSRGLDFEKNSTSDKRVVIHKIHDAICQARRMAGRRKTTPDGVSLYTSVCGSAKPPRKPDSLNKAVQKSCSATEENRTYINQMMDYSLAEKITRYVQSLRAEVKDVVFEPYGIGKAILTPEEKSKGTAIIDMGKMFTDLAIYKQGYIRYANSIPRAGEAIDLAIGELFDIDLWEAECVKEEIGTLNTFPIDIDKDISPIQIHSGTNKEPEAIDPQMAARIIRSELENLLDRVFTDLGHNGPLPETVVLTGNASLFKGLVTLVEDNYGVPARKVGKPPGFSGLAHVLNEPRYHCSFGLLRYGWECEQEYLEAITD